METENRIAEVRNRRSRLQIDLPAGTIRDLKVLAAQRDLTPSKLVAELVEQAKNAD